MKGITINKRSADHECKSKLDNYFGHERAEILPLLAGNFSTVMDVGGASGATLSLIKQHYPATKTICVDCHEQSLEIAAKRGHVAVMCDLDRDVPEGIGESDVVLFLDVLEHLVDPWAVLKRISAKVRPGCVIVISIPNVRFFPVSAGLLFRGRWEVTDAGILDRTHLRFFTRQSAMSLLTGAGLTLETVRSNLGSGRRWSLVDSLSFGLLRDFLAIQFLLKGTK